MTDEVDPLVDADERLRRYAELAVRVGANVQEGQEVVVTCQIEQRRSPALLPARPTAPVQRV